MRYDSDYAQLELSAEELAGAVLALGLELGPLAPGRLSAGTPQAQRAFEDALATLPDAARELLGTALEVLADPDRSLKLATTIAEASLHRAVYAWRGSVCSMLASRSGKSVLALATAADATSAILTPLLGSGTTVAMEPRADLDGRAVLAFVGAADALRFGRMRSLAVHAPAPEGLTAADVAQRLEDAMLDDPRWSVNLYASVLPFDPAAIMDVPTAELALGRLAAAGLFGITEADGAMPASYHPTDEALVALDAIAEADGRVAFTLFEKREDALAYESMLLARGRYVTLAVSLSPEGAGITPTTAAAIAALGERIAG